MKTTLEAAKEQTHKDTVKVLQNIIEKNYDAKKGYAKAMQEAKSPTLKRFLQQQAAQRGRFATAIDQKLRQLGAAPKESGSVTGAMHRTWIDLKSALANNDDEAVLEEVIRGEKASVDKYQEVIKKNVLVPNVKTVLQSQMFDIQSTLHKVKRLEDITA